MPVKEYKLTERIVKEAKPDPVKPTRDLLDGDGLYLRIYRNGRKVWSYNYVKDRRPHRTQLGEWPEMSLNQARVARDEMKARIRKGLPAVDNSGKTIREVTNAWYKDSYLDNKKRTRKYAPKYLQTIDTRLKDFVQVMGEKRIDSVTQSDLINYLEQRAKKAPEMARRTAEYIRAIFSYAEGKDLIKKNVATEELTKKITKGDRKHMAYTRNITKLAAIFRGTDRVKNIVTQTALRLVFLTFVRIGELLQARWKEFDFDTEIWNIPAEHTKRRREQLVPLSRQAIELLQTLYAYDAEFYRRKDIKDYLVFPAKYSRKAQYTAITEAGVLDQLKKICRDAAADGVYISDLTLHGFRTTADTLISESGKFSREAIKRQMAHVEKGVESIYNQAEYLDERTEIMQWWADHIDDIKAGKVQDPMVIRAAKLKAEREKLRLQEQASQQSSEQQVPSCKESEVAPLSKEIQQGEKKGTTPVSESQNLFPETDAIYENVWSSHSPEEWQQGFNLWMARILPLISDPKTRHNLAITTEVSDVLHFIRLQVINLDGQDAKVKLMSQGYVILLKLIRLNYPDGMGILKKTENIEVIKP